MTVLSNVLKDLPIQEAKFQANLISAKEFEEYLLEVIEYLAELSEIKVKPINTDYVKDYLWAILEFTI